MAVIDTINVGGADYKVQDSTARATANSAIANSNAAIASANAAVNALPTKINLEGDEYLRDIYALDGSSGTSSSNNRKKYHSTITSGLPTGANFGIREVYFYSAGHLSIILYDVGERKIFMNTYDTNLGWVGWITIGSGLPSSLLFYNQASESVQGYIVLPYELVKKYQFATASIANGNISRLLYSYAGGGFDTGNWQAWGFNTPLSLPETNPYPGGTQFNVFFQGSYNCSINLTLSTLR